ncbi:hypothetical protein EXE30_01035 [Acinetobacter halotolerans]|uniref:Uncharacterized protein n=1 Tax=Acinetobacter halotolerans TaxID=1752076 RepID=A0A4Q6XK91_9GAMM|nr:hypothetical protein [Acinetobacter halotolerans]RZF56872.1 hypothetical protein EXE30_01035 [Acinetobacter halotolerans]
MRTLIIVTIGLLTALTLLSLIPKKHLILAGIIFSIGWLGLVLWNLRIGLSHGYTLAQETPIHLILFVLPVTAYWLYFYFRT